MTTVARISDSYYSRPGDGYDGVGLVTTSAALGSGTLLAGGRAVLTAAHVVDQGSGPIRIAFDTAAGRTWSLVESVHIHTGYKSGSSLSNDLALLWLVDAAPLNIPRYQLYRTGDELGQVATLVGYGGTGTGISGFTGSAGQRTLVQNRIDTTRDALNDAIGGVLAPVPKGSQLLADFDSGSTRYDTLGRLMGLYDTGLGGREGSIAPGDSGGPAFIKGALAGVASYTSSFTLNGERLDSTSAIDGSFGEIAGWQRVSYYQNWIDEVLASLSSSSGGLPLKVIMGSAGNDLLIAGSDGAELNGLGGNDRLYTGPGNDILRGGAGVDVARVDLPADAVLITAQGNNTLHLDSMRGSDMLIDIELIRFEDQVVLTHRPELRSAGNLVFDQAFYLAANPDVARVGMDPLAHYLQWGASEGRNPNALFDEAFYRSQYQDVDAAIKQGAFQSAWQHYSAWGSHEGREPSAWMDTTAYLADNPDVAASGLDPLMHYLQWGVNEGRIIVANDTGLWG
ncbi:trypsin-like serine protease [Kushneria sp. Sum13]|uniref:trypsin-like serine protease n=1 Tax=Kushneria sp. Sum13 TaxID=3459196 RepID=UPI0040452644